MHRREALAEHGLSLNDYEALYLLSRADGRRLKRVELARRLVLTPSGVTRLLEGLEETGLVERAECSSDLRITYAQLTDAGPTPSRAASCDHEGSIRALLDEHLSADRCSCWKSCSSRSCSAASPGSWTTPTPVRSRFG